MIRAQRGRASRYRCGYRFRHRADACSNSTTVLQDELEEWVLSIVEDLVDGDELVKAAREARRGLQSRATDSTIRKLRGDLRDTERRIRNLVDAVGKGQSFESLKEGLEREEVRKRRILEEIDEIEGRHAAAIPSDAQLTEWATTFQDARSRGDVADLKEIIGLTLQSITVHPDGRVVALTNPLDPFAAPDEHVLRDQ